MAREKKKSEIISWIDESNDIELIAAVHESILQYKDKVDFWDNVNPEQKASIEKGLQEIKEGNIISHEEVKNRYEA